MDTKPHNINLGIGLAPEEKLAFVHQRLTEFSLKRGFNLKYSANYYPQGNEFVESTNKNLIRIIKRTIDQNHKN